MDAVGLPDCVKAYDIRGKFGEVLTEDFAYRIARAYAVYYQPQRVVVGRDVRLTSPALQQAVMTGFQDSGVDVWDLGMVGTEVVYAVAGRYADQGVSGGMVITASHNPIADNGIKMVQAGAQPVGSHNGLWDIARLAVTGSFSSPGTRGQITPHHPMPMYIETLMAALGGWKTAKTARRPLRVVVDPGHGCAGPVVQAIHTWCQQQGIPWEFYETRFEPDGHFPTGVPNPMIPSNRTHTAAYVRAVGADLGVAWDADFDRCFLFDETGTFIENYYINGLLADLCLSQVPPSQLSQTAIVYDPRLVWNTQAVAAQWGARAVLSRSGHTFMKATMRDVQAIYGGEISAHYYFQDFFYCDSGMLPWLLIAAHIHQSQKPLSACIAPYQTRFPCSGEYNFQIPDSPQILAQIDQLLGPQAQDRDTTDGLSLAFDRWRFNLRGSHTEPLIRLNLETRGEPALLAEKLQWFQAYLGRYTD